VEQLRALYEAAMAPEDVVGISIGTRPDCLAEDVVALLAQLNRKKAVYVELGLQSVHEASVRYIRRGYENSVYFDAVKRLRQAGIHVVTHIIIGLPGETGEMAVETTRQAVAAGTDGVKFHLLHVLKHTDLEKDYLELSGFDVKIENRGDKGLQTALKEDFDLIILDLMLPGMDGFEVCKKIREEKNVPILMVSAKKDDIDKIRGLGLGADDYITKPFSPSELVARVKAHMARYERLVGAGQKTNDIIEIRGLKIDKTARRVWINGEEKNFTTKEFDLLTFLAENPNHVFSKEELFAKIWNMESVGDIATVTVHIKKIREKIEVNTSKPQYIETIWGVGYRFKI
jgi:DNA-binding response OmpR family regulator